MAEFKCSKCGKSVEFSDDQPKLVEWAKNNPDKVQCKECKFGGTTKATGSTKSASGSKGGYTAKPKIEITPEMLHKAYDQVKAEFADILDEVQPFLGAWATTIVLNKVKG